MAKPGLPGVPEEKLLELIASFDTIYDIYSNLSKVENKIQAKYAYLKSSFLCKFELNKSKLYLETIFLLIFIQFSGN